MYVVSGTDFTFLISFLQSFIRKNSKLKMNCLLTSVFSKRCNKLYNIYCNGACHRGMEDIQFLDNDTLMQRL